MEQGVVEAGFSMQRTRTCTVSTSTYTNREINKLVDKTRMVKGKRKRDLVLFLFVEVSLYHHVVALKSFE